MWDLRLPAGIFFSALGVILCAVGLLAPSGAPLAPGTNVNLYSGISVLIFGGVMLWLAKRNS